VRVKNPTDSKHLDDVKFSLTKYPMQSYYFPGCPKLMGYQ